ncbi:MAG: hypothetical protein N4A49_09665 [Marinifilaceae bacterium]|jgi:ankyrin repeat protein|nr:hypothetical protein [Marinifilaceae bacterium]
MNQNQVYKIINHIQFNYGELFNKTKKIDLENPIDACGLCFYVDYIHRFLDHYTLKKNVANYIQWNTIIEAFNKLGLEYHANLIDQSCKIENEDTQAEEEIFYDWNTQSANAVFDKAVNYLSEYIENHIINTLDRYQYNFGEYLEMEEAIDFEKPELVSGLCSYANLILMYDTVADFSKKLLLLTDWETLFKAFNSLELSDHESLLRQFKDKKEEEKLIKEWRNLPVLEVFNKAVSYLNKNIKIDCIESRLSQLPPLDNSKSELLDAARIADFDWIKKLIDDGADPNITEDGKETALSHVWYEYNSSFNPPQGALAALKLLVKAGANPNIECNARILEDTLNSPDPEIFELLLENGWDINQHSNDPIIYRLIKESNPQERHAERGAGERYRQCLEIALRYKPNLNVISKFQKLSPLSISYSQQLSDRLIELGSELTHEAKDNFYDLTPLMMACFNENIEDVEYWLKKGIDPNLRLAFSFTKKLRIPAGLTALDIAEINTNKEIISLLKKHKAINGKKTSRLINLLDYNKEVKDIDETKKILAQKIDEILPPNSYQPGFVPSKRSLENYIGYLIEDHEFIDLMECYDLELANSLYVELEKMGFTVSLD